MRYIVVRTKDEVIHICERRQVGEVEVYEPVAVAPTIGRGGAVADALNQRPIPEDTE